MIDLSTLSNKVIFQNTLSSWLLALIVVIVCTQVLKFLCAKAHRIIRSAAKRTTTQLDDILVVIFDNTKPLFLLLVSLFLGTKFLVLPAPVDIMIQRVALFALLIQAAIWINSVIRFCITDYTNAKLADDAGQATTVKSIGLLSRIVVWCIITLMALDNIGIDVNALIAGMGIGGIAVALAAQNIIGDIFASISIVLDKPFVLGDFIIVGDYMGNIENIGLKTTRIRSLSGEQVVFNNNDLLQSRIRNYKRMFERRVVFTLGVVYQTPQEKMAKIPGIIKDIITSRTQARFDRAHFKTFGNFSLDFEVVYYVLSPEFNVYMDNHQAINLAVMERFAQEGISFAYPTQTLFLNQEPS